MWLFDGFLYVSFHDSKKNIKIIIQNNLFEKNIWIYYVILKKKSPRLYVFAPPKRSPTTTTTSRKFVAFDRNCLRNRSILDCTRGCLPHTIDYTIHLYKTWRHGKSILTQTLHI